MNNTDTLKNFSVNISNEAVKEFALKEFGFVPKTQAEFLTAKGEKIRKELGERINEKIICKCAYERQNRGRNQGKHSENEESCRNLRGRRTRAN